MDYTEEKNCAKLDVEEILEQKRDFTIISLTGKIKSGTSDICELLTDEKFYDRVRKPADTSEIGMREVRERTICYRYLYHNWKPFVVIDVTSVILSFLLESSIDELKTKLINSESGKPIGENEKDSMYYLIGKAINDVDFEKNVKQKLYSVIRTIKWGKNLEDDENMANIMSTCDQMLKENKETKKLIKMWEEYRKMLENNNYFKIEIFCFCFGILPAINDSLEKELREKNAFTSLYQDYGNNIRAYGRANVSSNVDSNTECKAESIFCMPRRINKFIKILRHYVSFECQQSADNKNSQNIKKSNSIYIVINNFKNIFEAFYFRCRYASFYLLAVTCNEEERKARFKSDFLYRKAELNENLSLGKSVYRRAEKYREDHNCQNESDWCRKQKGLLAANFNDAERDFVTKLYSSGGSLRQKCYNDNRSDFILQDVVKCIEDADLFLKRNFNEEDCKCDYELIWALGRMVTLMMHPGLLTPTTVERCMQVAMTAKLNSGCLSRQVGAVVTDAEYNILSLGWNDSPCGTESCIRRNIFEAIQKHDKAAYSDFELHDDEFREYLSEVEKVIDEERKTSMQGLPFAFCFKDIYQDIIHQRDQIYTRALHAEERAMAMCKNAKLIGGCLFTTSSPCELCAKKVKEMGIDKIYYIEQYKGISQPHIINVGKHRAEYILFTGAIGLAYVKFYTPLIPYKDELKALGYEPSRLHKEHAKVKLDDKKTKEYTVQVSPEQETQEE